MGVWATPMTFRPIGTQVPMCPLESSIPTITKPKTKGPFGHRGHAGSQQLRPLHWVSRLSGLCCIICAFMWNQKNKDGWALAQTKLWFTLWFVMRSTCDVHLDYLACSTLNSPSVILFCPFLIWLYPTTHAFGLSQKDFQSHGTFKKIQANVGSTKQFYRLKNFPLPFDCSFYPSLQLDILYFNT